MNISLVSGGMELIQMSGAKAISSKCRRLLKITCLMSYC